MTIYTRIGDDGTTGIYKGCRVNKDTPLMEAIGTVDELNSTLGVAVSFLQKKSSHKKIIDGLYQIQKDLFTVGAVLAGSERELRINPTSSAKGGLRGARNYELRIKELEKQIDEMWEKLPPLKNFIFPGGTNLAASLFLARAVCRRAERRTVGLKKYPILVKYLNRLSDYLFVLARYVNYLEREKEIVWAE